MEIQSLNRQPIQSDVRNLDGFKLFLAQSGRRKSTIKVHISMIKLLLRNCPTLSQEEIDLFFLTLHSKGYKGSYINHFNNTLRVYGQYVPVPYISPKYFKEENFVKATMSDDEIDAFLSLPCAKFTFIHWHSHKAVTRRTDPEGYKIFTMFFSICAFSGMRMGEVANLTTDRVDFGRGVFVLEETKTNTPRYVPIAPNISEDLKVYISKLKGNLLFPSRRGGRGEEGVISNVDWHYNFKTRIKRLGIKRKNLSPYSLRHSFITRLLEQDVNIFKVQKIVGHRNIETTNHYTHLTTKDIQAAITKHPLIQKSTSPQEIIQSLVKVIEAMDLNRDKRFSYSIDQSEGSVTIKLLIR